MDIKYVLHLLLPATGTWN